MISFSPPHSAIAQQNRSQRKFVAQFALFFIPTANTTFVSRTFGFAF
jgi:hypothetical protein